jgi:hypothetical protein
MSDSERERYQRALWHAMNHLAVGGMSDAGYQVYRTLEELSRALDQGVGCRGSGVGSELSEPIHPLRGYPDTRNPTALHEWDDLFLPENRR